MKKLLLTICEIIICLLIFIPGLLACLALIDADLHTNDVWVKPMYISFVLLGTMLFCWAVVALCEHSFNPKNQTKNATTTIDR